MYYELCTTITNKSLRPPSALGYYDGKPQKIQEMLQIFIANIIHDKNTTTDKTGRINPLSSRIRWRTVVLNVPIS